MSWSLLIQAFAKFFGPLLAALLQELFTKALGQLSDTPSSQPPAVVVSRLFGALRSQTWVWQFGKRRALATAERIALTRAPEILTALRDGRPLPQMTAAEAAEVELL